ncbi:hypothetical protein R3W88_016210 [Solanum pinnatisectum]|uniref:Aspartic peptidase DDI1-type domain-containing protein n=1 Tax=Solanum pinnatisectum TaxID=50273 RepID=A0AAV9KXX0_9SOLN|nr:hypothetical protein R3W88_016210 [Solanum pinnatisectum]
MPHMRTQINLLTKHIVTKSEKVDVVGQQNMYEDQDLDLDEEANYLGSQGGFQNYNSGNQGGSSSGSKLEDMMAKVLQKDGHCLAIPTRSGKIPTNHMSAGTKHEQALEQAGRDEDETVQVDDSEEFSVNIPLVEALEKMPGYAKFKKDLVTKKRVVSLDFTNDVHHCSSITSRSLVQKKEYPGAFTISCTIGSISFAKALCDLGASINLMPLAIYKKLGLGFPKPITMRLMMADRSVKRPVGVLCDVLVKVDTFIFLDDFVILDCKVDFEVPIILGRSFLAIRRALVDAERGELKFRLNKDEIKFNICMSIKQPNDMNVVSTIEMVADEDIRVPIEERDGR